MLVEGFKTEHIPKIEVHRADLGKPLLFPDDPDIVAIATDVEPDILATDLPQLNLNLPAEVADFILNLWLKER